MKKLIIKEIVNACGGKLFGGEELLSAGITGIETDSRLADSGKLFIPIIGERFDGHDFIGKAFENGALITLSEKDIGDGPYIKVESTFQALKDIAEYYRSLFDVKVIAVTGSVGKTTAKEMISAVLSQKFNILKSQKNFNNEIGVPQTLFNLEDEHEVAVIEMGMNHFGEISRLSKTARPDICVISNIGHSHVGYLKSREGIFKAKSEIFEYMNPEGTAVLNGDDDLLYSIKDKGFNTEFFGYGENNDVKISGYKAFGFDSSQMMITYEGKSFEVKVPLPGQHMGYAVGAAYAIGKRLGMSDSEIAEGILAFESVGKRMDIIDTGKITIINDVYNASPESVKAAIDVLCTAPGRKVCVLGDMFELGDMAPELHRQIGVYAAQKGVDYLILAGELSANTKEGAKSQGAQRVWFKTQDEMIEKISEHIKEGDTILVKASRGMHFEDTVEFLKNV